MYRSKKRRNIIILSLIGVLFLMAAGYAAFKTNLQITGNTKITSNWDVEITKVSEGEKKGQAENVNKTWSKTEANLEANLYAKGDSISYIVTIENLGTIDAKLDNINIGGNTNNEAINISFSGYTKGQTLKKGDFMDVTVTISYNPNYEGGETSSKVNTNFDFVQNEGETITPTNDYLVRYDYVMNGGTSSDSENEYLSEESSVNLDYKAQKEGYEFVGWNTNSNAKEGLNELKLIGDTTLYAIFKKDIKVTYEKDENVSSIGKTSDTCTMYNNDKSCEITLPNIEVNTGYGVNGWYNGETNVGMPNSKYNVNNNTTLTAKVIQIDNIGPNVSINPSVQSNYTNGTEVTIELNDASGIKEGQTISYAWSIRNNESPFTSDTQIQTVKINNQGGENSVTITIPKSASSNLTGTYYLWIKGGIEDVLGNASVDKVSGSFKFDNSLPSVNISTSSTTDRITVTANATALSGIEKYEFSINGGTWYQSDNTIYTFSGLNDGTEYNVSVRVTSEMGKVATTNTVAITQSIPLPTFERTGHGTTTIVTITYPEGCGNKYTCSYIKDDGRPVEVNDSNVDVEFTENGNLIAIVSDGTNEVSNVYKVEDLQIIQAWSSNANTDFHNQDIRKNINSVEVVDYNTVPENAVDSWDVSEKGDGGVMAWIIDDTLNEGKYNLYIGGNGGVLANSNTSYMFYNFQALKTVDFTKFDTSTATDMGFMFKGCGSLVTPDVTSFDTSNVTDMQQMFYNCIGITELDVTTFKTTTVTNMDAMFYGCSNLKSIDVTNFDTSNTTDITNMFFNCMKFTSIDVSNFKTSNVTRMGYMFSGCTNLTEIDLSNFDTSKVKEMQQMFLNCSKLVNLNISSFNTINVTRMDSMFRNCSSLTDLDLSHFKTDNVVQMDSMFVACNKLVNLNISSFNTSKVTNMSSMFYNCSGLTELDVSNFDTSNVNDMSNMFYNNKALISLDVRNFVTSKVTNMSNMFKGCSSLTDLDLSHFTTDKVTRMDSMLASCDKLVNLNISGFVTSKVTNMSSMFNGCTSLANLDVTEFSTDNVTDMSSMFNGCSALTSLDLSNFVTSKVTNMSNMFRGAKKLLSLNLNNFNTAQVINMNSMFNGCTDLTELDVQEFDTTQVTNMNSMFSNCQHLMNLDISSFNTSNVTDMQYMFSSTLQIQAIYVGPNWTTANANTLNMFLNSKVSDITQK